MNRLIETDAGGRIVYATPEAASVLGVATRDLVGRDLCRMFPEQQQQLRRLLRAVLVSSAVREAVAVTIEHPREATIDAQLTALRLDPRRVQWRVTRLDET